MNFLTKIISDFSLNHTNHFLYYFDKDIQNLEAAEMVHCDDFSYLLYLIGYI